MPPPRTGSLVTRLFPELRALPEDARAAAWRRAVRAPFDSVELAAMAIAVVGVTWLTQYAAGALAPLDRGAWAIANFAIALPLLAVALAPVAWRRTRRALREDAERARRGAGGARP